MNNNYNSNTVVKQDFAVVKQDFAVVKQDFAVVKQVDIRAAQI